MGEHPAYFEEPQACAQSGGDQADRDAGRAGCALCGVRRIGVCSALDREALADLEAISRRRTVRPCQAVAVEGEAAEFAFSVTTGGLKIQKSLRNGRTQMVGLLMVGGFLGLPPRGLYQCSAEALPGTTLCQYPRAGLLRVLERHPAVEDSLLLAAYDELAAAQDHMLLLGRLHAIERVTVFLLQLQRRMTSLGLPSRSVSLPLQRHEIADYLGLTTETVSRAFTQLRSAGIIRLERPTLISILDPGRLADLVDAPDDDAAARVSRRA